MPPAGRIYLCISRIASFTLIIALLFGTFLIWHSVLAANSSTITTLVTVPAATPSISSVRLNSNNSITLTPNATTTVYVNYTVTDANGCGDIANISSTVFRVGGASSTCEVEAPTTNNLNCYIYASNTTSSCISSSQLNGTSTFYLYYFAQATDASSSFSNDAWTAYVVAKSASGITSTTGNATSSYDTLNTLNAIAVSTTTINYGTVPANTNTGNTNQLVNAVDAGNSSTSLQLYASQTLVNGSNSISTSSQHYATSTFTYGGAEQQLSGAAATVSGLTIHPPINLSHFSQPWADTTPLPSNIQYFGGAAYNGYLYTLGGEDTNNNQTTTVFYAPVSATGTVGTWNTTTALPSKINSLSALAYNGYLYSTGGTANGEASTNATTTVFYSSISSNGTIGSWATPTALPSVIDSQSAVAYNGYLYEVGGGDVNGNPTSTVNYAPINANGTVGTWNTTTALPSALESGVAVYSGYLYTAGGCTNSGCTTTSTVYYAAINANGTVGTWNTTTALPSPNIGATNAYNGFLYALFGFTGSAATSTVYYAPIGANGTVGSWSNAIALPSPLDGGFAVISNGYFYSMGGEFSGGNNDTSTVFYVPLDVRPTYWGLAVPNGTASGTYSGTNVFQSLFSP